MGLTTGTVGLQEADAIEQCIADAQTAGDDELAQFEQMQADDRDRVSRAKALVSERLLGASRLRTRATWSGEC